MLLVLFSEIARTMEVGLSNAEWMSRIGYPSYVNSLELHRPRSPARTTTDASSCLSPLGRKTVMKNFKRAEMEAVKRKDREMDAVKRKTRAVTPESVRRRKQRRLKKNGLSKAGEGEDAGSRFSLRDNPVFHWWSGGGSYGTPSLGSSVRREDLAEKLSFDEKKLFEITNKSDRAKLGRAGQLVYLKRMDHELLGTQFQQDDSGRMWILINFFKGSVPFSYREQDAIRSACGPTFSDMEVLVNFFENEAEREACGALCMTQVIVKMVKEEALASGALIYEPK